MTNQEEPRVSAEESAKWVARIREGDVILVDGSLRTVLAVHENGTGPRTFTLEPFERPCPERQP